MSWIHNSFNGWSPHWMFLSGNKQLAIHIPNQSTGDTYFEHLGYETDKTTEQQKPTEEQKKGRRNLYRPEVLSPEAVRDKIEEYRARIRDNKSAAQKLIDKKEALWLLVLDKMVEKNQAEKYLEPILSAAWNESADISNPEKEMMPLGMSHDLVWLREQFRAPLGEAVAAVAPPWPRNSPFSDYRTTWTQRLTYRNGAYDKNAPNDAILLAPQINKATLLVPGNFALFVLTRTLHEPLQFWLSDFNQTYIGRSTRSISQGFCTGHVMNFEDSDQWSTYGGLEALSNEVDAASRDNLCNGRSLSVDEGLRLLSAQDFIYRFLRRCCEQFNARLSVALDRAADALKKDNKDTAMIPEELQRKIQELGDKAIAAGRTLPPVVHYRDGNWMLLRDDIIGNARVWKQLFLELRRDPKLWWERADMFAQQHFCHIQDKRLGYSTLEGNMVAAFAMPANNPFWLRRYKMMAPQELVVNVVERTMYWDNLAGFCQSLQSDAAPSDDNLSQLYIRTRFVLADVLKDLEEYRFQGAKKFRHFFERTTIPAPTTERHSWFDPSKTTVELSSSSNDAAEYPRERLRRGEIPQLEYDGAVKEWEWRQELARLIQLASNPVSLDTVGVRALADGLSSILSDQEHCKSLLRNQVELLADICLLSRVLVFLEEIEPFPYRHHHNKDMWAATMRPTTREGTLPFGKIHEGIQTMRHRIRNPPSADIHEATSSVVVDRGIALLYRDGQVEDILSYASMPDPKPGYLPQAAVLASGEGSGSGSSEKGGDGDDVAMGNTNDNNDAGRNDDAQAEPMELDHPAADNTGGVSANDGDDASADDEAHTLTVTSDDFSVEKYARVVFWEDQLRDFWWNVDGEIRKAMDDTKNRRPQLPAGKYNTDKSAPDKSRNPYGNLVYTTDALITQDEPWTPKPWKPNFENCWNGLRNQEPARRPGAGPAATLHFVQSTTATDRNNLHARAIPLRKREFDTADILFNNSRPEKSMHFNDMMNFLRDAGFQDYGQGRSKSRGIRMTVVQGHPTIEPRRRGQNLNLHKPHEEGDRISRARFRPWTREELVQKMGMNLTHFRLVQSGELYGWENAAPAS